MKQLMIYAIESSVCLTIFMLFYQLFLARDTLYTRNRMYLLITLVFSVQIPALRIDYVPGVFQTISSQEYQVVLPGLTIAAEGGQSFYSVVLSALPVLYITGLLIMLMVLLVSSVSIIILIVFNRPDNGRVIRINTLQPTCFSAFGYIFISSSIANDSAHRMMNHEMNHIRLMHSIDLVISALTLCIQWFNPAAYFFRRSLEAVHEYEADRECLRNGEERSSYQMLLLAAALGTHVPVITSKFSKTSLLKKRIAMMTKERSGRISSMKLVAVIPLTLLMFLVFSCREKDQTVREKQEIIPNEAFAASDESTVVKTDIYAASVDSTVYAVVEKMPVFPGGEKALLSYIYKHLTYPPKAKELGIQGKVICRFCIDEQGKVIYPQVYKGSDPLLDQEAYDVISSLPDFKPGMQGGKPVKVWFTLPVSFQLK